MNIRDFFYRLIGVSGVLFFVNALYYLYQLVLNHGLSPSAYGDMTSIIAWTVLASIPSVALGIFVTRYITLHAGDRAKQQSFARAILSRMLRLSIFIVPIILIGYWIAPYMSLSWLSYTAIICTVMLMLFLGFFRSIAYVDGRLQLYTINVAFEIVFRIVVTWILFSYTQSIPVLYFVYFLSIFFALCFFARDIRALIVGVGNWSFSLDEVRDMRQHILPMIFFSCFVTSIGSIELVMARRILSSEDLGYFSALIVVSKIVLAGLSIWPAVAMPYFAQTRKNLKILIIIYIGLLLSILIALVVFRIFGDRIVSLLFPPGYAHIVVYMMPVISAMLIAALMGMVIQHAVIAGQKIAGYLSIVLPLSIIGVLFFTDGTLLATTDGLLMAYSIGAIIWASFFLMFSYKKIMGR